MDILTIRAGAVAARICPQGGLLLDATFDGGPFLRPYAGSDRGRADPLLAASFPMVPVGNRIAGNRFTFEGRSYRVDPNTDLDPLYMHGDGWQNDWEVVATTATDVLLRFHHRRRTGSPYVYTANQRFAVTEEALVLDCSVANDGDYPLPFGLGHHLYFPLTHGMRLFAPATGFWTERAGYLPDQLVPVPDDLNFANAKRLPAKWINNGFQGWTGRARIAWPENNLAVEVDGTPAFAHYFLFRPDHDFDPEYRDDFFCFEPMTHCANAHNRDDRDGLVRLAPGDELRTQLRLRPRTDRR